MFKDVKVGDFVTVNGECPGYICEVYETYFVTENPYDPEGQKCWFRKSNGEGIGYAKQQGWNATSNF